MIEPLQHEFSSSGPRLTYFEWPATEPALPVVFLVHATGFHGRCWDQVVEALPAHGGVYAIDMRGHGRSERVAPYVWETFGRDIVELIEHLGVRHMVGVGHSLGGHCLTQVAGQHPDFFDRLLLVDPVIFEPDAYGEDRYRGFAGPADHPVAKRRNHWRDWREMYERFEDRLPFSLWRKAVLEDYCRYGVVSAAQPADVQAPFELACPPDVEASVYLGNTGTDVYGLIPGIRIPVTILRARRREEGERDMMDFSMSPTWPRLAEQFADARDVYLPDLTHFIPMQAPELVARLVTQPDAPVPEAAS